LVRKPAVAGEFYPAEKKTLANDIKRLFDSTEAVKIGSGRRSVFGAVVPHAGIEYSGSVAAEVFSAIEVPESIILICPNHTPYGKRVSICVEGEWETPLGRVAVDSTLAGLVKQYSDMVSNEPSAHSKEHSIEVILPFIQHVNPKAMIVPVSIMNDSFSYQNCQKLAGDISRAVKAHKKPALIVASSDMNHYEPQQVTIRKDKLAIDRIILMDAKGLFNAVVSHEITMCGYIPAVVAIEACEALGATRAELLRYTTSGETYGDLSSVVGYAGIVIY